MGEKNKISKELKEKLFLKRKNGYTRISSEDEKASFAFADDYKAFLDTAKTEREAVEEALRLLKAKGFTEYKKGMKLKADADEALQNIKDDAEDVCYDARYEAKVKAAIDARRAEIEERIRAEVEAELAEEVEAIEAEVAAAEAGEHADE